MLYLEGGDTPVRRVWWVWAALLALPQLLVVGLWAVGQVTLAFWLMYGGGGIIALVLLGREVRKASRRGWRRLAPPPRSPLSPGQRLIIPAALCFLLALGLKAMRETGGAGLLVLITGGLLFSAACGILLEQSGR